jgi:hypothetical protein
MKDHLKAAVKRYPVNLENSLIHPLSNIDAEILVEIGEILRKAKLDSVKKILDGFKYLKDAQIYDALLQWNIDNPEKKESSTDVDTIESEGKSKVAPSHTRNFISFKDFRIDLALIRSYEKKDEFNFAKGQMEYFIIINNIPDTTGVTNAESNKVVRYIDMELRDMDFGALDMFVKGADSIHFVNEI